MAPRDYKNEVTHRTYPMLPTKQKKYLATKLSSCGPDGTLKCIYFEKEKLVNSKVNGQFYFICWLKKKNTEGEYEMENNTITFKAMRAAQNCIYYYDLRKYLSFLD